MMKTPKNPFVLTGYWGEEYFCDREEELAWLQEQMENERNVVLHSWRRMGKTALIERFFAEKEKGKASPLHVDLLGTRNMEEAIARILQAVQDRFGRVKGGFSERLQRFLGRIGASFSFDPTSGEMKLQLEPKGMPEPERSLEEIGRFLCEEEQEPVLALDEFQQVTRYAEGNGEALFRSLTQRFPEIRFIFSGSHRNLMRALFQDEKRPFFKSAQLRGVGPIPEASYVPFIQGHFHAHGKVFDEELIRQLLIWSRGQTYTVQLLCNLLFASCDKVTPDELTRVQNEAMEQDEPWFHEIGRSLTDMQWYVLKAVAKEEPLKNPLGQDFIIPYRLGAASSVDRALKALKEKALVVEDEEGLWVHEVLLAKWLEGV